MMRMPRAVSGLRESLEVGDGADRGMDLAKVGNIVTVVFER